MYDVVFSELADKQFGKLDRKLQERITAGLERIRIRPERHVKRLVGVPWHSLRIGDYRVIIEINQGRLMVLVVKIGHRSKIYD
jgi:mRNA interferase RelE/StbE